VGTVTSVYDRVPGVTDFEPIASDEVRETFRAIDIETGDRVVVKVLAKQVSDEQFDRFTSVCRAVRSIDRHPNIARLYDAGTTSDSHPYVVVEHQDRSLSDLIGSEGRLRWQEAVALGAEIASALEAAHRMNVVHGDVAPRNILLADDDVPRITDFGVRALETAPDTTGATGSRATLSRLSHMAPEVVQGRSADARSDIYSLASTLFEALAGAPPFIRPTDETVVPVVSRLLGEGPPSLSSLSVPAPVEATIVGAMAKDPTMRPGSAELFRQELLAAARTATGPEMLATAAAARAAGTPQGAHLGRRSDRTRSANGSPITRRRRRRRGVDLGIAAVALIAVIAIIVVATRSGDKNDSAANNGATTGVLPAGSTSPAASAPSSTAVSTSVAATTTIASTSSSQPPSTDPTGSDPLTTDPTGTEGEPSTTPAPESNTLALTGSGFHLTSFASNAGTTLTFPAGKDFHEFEYSVSYSGGENSLACPGHTGLKRVEGPGLSNLKLGGCFRPGRDSAKIRIRAYFPGKVTFTVYLCDVDVFVGYCNGPTRSTNGVDITVIAT